MDQKTAFTHLLQDAVNKPGVISKAYSAFDKYVLSEIPKKGR